MKLLYLALILNVATIDSAFGQDTQTEPSELSQPLPTDVREADLELEDPAPQLGNETNTDEQTQDDPQPLEETVPIDVDIKAQIDQDDPTETIQNQLGQEETGTTPQEALEETNQGGIDSGKEQEEVKEVLPQNNEEETGSDQVTGQVTEQQAESQTTDEESKLESQQTDDGEPDVIQQGVSSEYILKEKYDQDLRQMQEKQRQSLKFFSIIAAVVFGVLLLIIFLLLCKVFQLRTTISRQIRLHEQEAKHLFHVTQVKTSMRGRLATNERVDSTLPSVRSGKKEKMKDRILRIENEIEQRSVLNLKSRDKRRFSSYSRGSPTAPLTELDNSNYGSALTHAGTIQHRSVSDGPDECGCVETQSMKEEQVDTQPRAINQNGNIQTQFVKEEKQSFLIDE